MSYVCLDELGAWMRRTTAGATVQAKEQEKLREDVTHLLLVAEAVRNAGQRFAAIEARLDKLTRPPETRCAEPPEPADHGEPSPEVEEQAGVAELLTCPECCSDAVRTSRLSRCSGSGYTHTAMCADCGTVWEPRHYAAIVAARERQPVKGTVLDTSA